MEYISSLGLLGVFLAIIAFIFIIVSCLMWYLVPWWIRSIKNSVKKLHDTPIMYETHNKENHNYERELKEIHRELVKLNENINNIKYLPH